jgi:hypothetical protein
VPQKAVLVNLSCNKEDAIAIAIAKFSFKQQNCLDARLENTKQTPQILHRK